MPSSTELGTGAGAGAGRSAGLSAALPDVETWKVGFGHSGMDHHVEWTVSCSVLLHHLRFLCQFQNSMAESAFAAWGCTCNIVSKCFKIFQSKTWLSWLCLKRDPEISWIIDDHRESFSLKSLFWGIPNFHSPKGWPTSLCQLEHLSRRYSCYNEGVHIEFIEFNCWILLVLN